MNIIQQLIELHNNNNPLTVAKQRFNGPKESNPNMRTCGTIKLIDATNSKFKQKVIQDIQHIVSNHTL